VPVHLRAEPGDYAEACLLPGDPLRARWIAEKLLDDARQVNGERGLLGYTGTYAGRPVSVQATGMGAPTTGIVAEELIQLGVKRLVRVGTCGGLRPELALGDLLVALSAVPADRTSEELVGGEPHAPTADWDLLHGIVHAAKELGERPHVGPIATSATFYDPDPGRHDRWGARGVLGVEMESALLFTLAPLRGVRAATILVVSDLVFGGKHKRIADDLLATSVERMTRIALTSITKEPK
jgi:DeoD family purine-nucleoside phosphorylase